MEKEIGKISHFFGKISVGIIELTAPLAAGDTIRVKGSETDFVQKVESMQVEHSPVENAEAGQGVGVKFTERARENDTVYKVEE